MTVWCKGFLKAHAALWQPAVRWALRPEGSKQAFVHGFFSTFVLPIFFTFIRIEVVGVRTA